MNYGKTGRLAAVLLFAVVCWGTSASAWQGELNDVYGLAVHGGAGTILKKNMTDEQEAAFRAKLEEAILAGYHVLEKGGTGMDAVEAVIVILEDSPLFNAGKGAVFTHDGSHELDASVMDGKTLDAGAVAGVRHVRNPIKLARLVMTDSPHVMLSGAGAEAFAKAHNQVFEDAQYFHTDRRWEQLQKVLQEEKAGKSSSLRGVSDRTKFGTVGVAALDRHGNLAAGTSTGGMTNKRWGRIGDSPVIGAGTYADNATCAISSTGHGEFFIRAAVAHDIAARMAYKGISLQQAADEVVMDKLVKMGGTGGVVGIDAKGNIAMVFNTEGMYRASVREDGKPTVKIYKE